MQFKPLGEYLLIKQDVRSNKIGSIIVESVSNHPPQSGKVLYVGPKCVDITVGDHVQFEMGEFQILKLDEGEFILVKESKIIGVFTDE